MKLAAAAGAVVILTIAWGSTLDLWVADLRAREKRGLTKRKSVGWHGRTEPVAPDADVNDVPQEEEDDMHSLWTIDGGLWLEPRPRMDLT